eukprot:14651053-Alexandrium_andersonii.AAC.1
MDTHQEHGVPGPVFVERRDVVRSRGPQGSAGLEPTADALELLRAHPHIRLVYEIPALRPVGLVEHPDVLPVKVEGLRVALLEEQH